jgi:hypothetical protein
MFSVGDVVTYRWEQYRVLSVSRDGVSVEVDSVQTGRNQGMNAASLFTLHTPATPPPPVLTGMTQFFKDQKEKKLNETSI